MSDRPDPPMEIAQYILDGFDRQSPEKLRTIATYAEDLAAWRDQSDLHGEATENEPDGQDLVDCEHADDRLEGVPQLSSRKPSTGVTTTTTTGSGTRRVKTNRTTRHQSTRRIIGELLTTILVSCSNPWLAKSGESDLVFSLASNHLT